jgi:hypothetical protein
MILLLLTLITAILLSGVAAYFSIVGLIAIFAAAPIPIAIMGSSLELAKLVAASWVYRNWTVAPSAIKYYFTAAVVILSLITSMGIFGYLSKAHMDQSLVSGDILARILIYDEKIKVAKENKDANRKTIKQLDEAVDQTMARSTDEKGADKASQLRRSQTKERARLLQEIETEQKKISQFTEERAPIAAEARKVEAEVGPVKYIAALMYGDNPDQNLLEKAVRWVTIIIVLVFDPMAILLLIAANFSLKQRRGEEITAVEKPETPATNFFEEPILQEPVVEETSQDKKEGWSPEMYRRARHEIPKEIMDKVFRK